MPLSHDDLAILLAGHLRTDKRMTWTDMQLGPSGSPRPDVYTINKSFVNSAPTAYECKVSTADFRSDVTSGKWQSYLKYACGVYFACEGDLIKNADVPAHAGLMVLNAEGVWRTAKRATMNAVTIPKDAWLKLLIDGVQREGPRYRAKHFSESVQIDRVRMKFGAVVARTVCDRLAVEHEISSAEYTAKRIIEDANARSERIRSESLLLVEPLRMELCEILEMPSDTAQWHLAAAVKRIRKEMAEHPAHAAHRTMTAQLQSALNHYGFKEAAAANGEADD